VALTTVYGSPQWDTAGGGWCTQHFIEHYRYTGDRDLKQRTYPILREASLFYLDWLS
jgi:alpha-L-fucosidase 2